MLTSLIHMHAVVRDELFIYSLSRRRKHVAQSGCHICAALNIHNVNESKLVFK